MARPRKPTKLHVVQGTLRTTRHRDRENEPEIIEPLGGPPVGWPIAAKLLWAELSDLIPPGVAGKSDRLAFELLCRLVGSMRDGTEGLTAALAGQIRAACGAFGMTPADRSRVSALLPPEENVYARPGLRELMPPGGAILSVKTARRRPLPKVFTH